MQQEYIGDNLEELIDEEAASVACNLANTVDICGLGVFGEKVLGVADRDDDVVDWKLAIVTGVHGWDLIKDFSAIVPTFTHDDWYRDPDTSKVLYLDNGCSIFTSSFVDSMV